MCINEELEKQLGQFKLVFKSVTPIYISTGNMYLIIVRSVKSMKLLNIIDMDKTCLVLSLKYFTLRFGVKMAAKMAANKVHSNNRKDPTLI